MTCDVKERATKYRMGLKFDGPHMTRVLLARQTDCSWLAEELHTESFRGNIDETIAWLQAKKAQMEAGSTCRLSGINIRCLTPKRMPTKHERIWAETAYENREGEQWKPYEFLED